MDGIPRFVQDDDEDQAQVRDSFAYKWERRSTYDAERRREIAAQWITERYGFESSTRYARTSRPRAPFSTSAAVRATPQRRG